MAKGEKKSCGSFHLYYMVAEHFQAGVCVSRKLGDAVVRNRIKRVLREAIRHSRTILAHPCHVVLMARPGAERLSALEAQAHLTELYGTARLALAVKA
jgi:ribonuclease P protein component